MSIALPWSDCKTYGATIGPAGERPARPRHCVYCDGERVWFNGWRAVRITVLVEERPWRAADGVLLQRVRCARRVCGRSWTLRPPWLAPHRSLQPDVAEAAALRYLLDPAATYAAVATAFTCAWITVWRWVGGLAALVAPAAVLAEAARLGAPGGADPRALPRTVPAAGRARSAARARAVEQAAQVLGALAMLHRAQPEPPADPSPLRWWLTRAVLAVLAVRRPGGRRPGPAPRR